MDRRSGSACTVIGFCTDRAIGCLIREASEKLKLRFHRADSLGEALRTLHAASNPILLIECRTLTDEVVRSLEKARKIPSVSIIVILAQLNETTEAVAIRSGAITCLSSQLMACDLLYQIEVTITAISVGARAGDRRSSGQILLVSEKVTFALPSLCLTDGKLKTRVPHIPGMLLACLAAHPNQVVPSRELTQAAWGTESGVTEDALYQQMHQLRSILSQFGVSEQLRTVNARGYMLQRCF